MSAFSKAMRGGKTLSFIRWTDEITLFVYDYLRRGTGDAHIASRMGVTVEALALDLSKTTKPTLLKGLAMREKLFNRRAENTVNPPYYARDRAEKRCQEMFGISLEERSDVNVLWMRDNGYGRKLRTTEEKTNAGIRLKRLHGMREKRQEYREQMEAELD